MIDKNTTEQQKEELYAEEIPESVPEINIDSLPGSLVDTGRKSRRGVKIFDKNPFVAEAAKNAKIGRKRIVNKTGDKLMIVNGDTGEIVAPAGFHEIVEVDKTAFVKLYINGVRAFKGLKAAGTAVFEVIYREVQEAFGEDELYLHYAGIDQHVTPMSEATFYRGMKEMLEKGFIAESTRPNVYFLNIDYLFSGNKLAFIKEFRLKDPARKPKEVADLSSVQAKLDAPQPDRGPIPQAVVDIPDNPDPDGKKPYPEHMQKAFQAELSAVKRGRGRPRKTPQGENDV